MADNKGTPEQNTRHEYTEVKGKTLDTLELVVEPDFYAIAIRFNDKTALTFVIEPCVFTFPVLEDWTQGEAQIIKEYESVQSTIDRA